MKIDTKTALEIVRKNAAKPAYKKAASIICFDLGRTAEKEDWYNEMASMSDMYDRSASPVVEPHKVELALIACGYTIKAAKERSTLAECGDRQIAYRRERQRDNMRRYREANKDKLKKYHRTKMAEYRAQKAKPERAEGGMK